MENTLKLGELQMQPQKTKKKENMFIFSFDEDATLHVVSLWYGRTSAVKNCTQKHEVEEQDMQLQSAY